MQVRLLGVHTVRRKLKDGTFSVHYYHRKTKKKLKGAPGSPDFLKSYAAAENEKRDHLGHTFAALVRKFENSPEFAAIAETTRKEYRRKFRIIDPKWGACPITALTDREFRRDVLEWRDQLAPKGRREADNLVSTIARVLSFALDRGEIEVNVLAHFRRAYKADRRDKIWLPSHIDAFRKVASSEMAAALMLALHTGQRQGDLLRLRWADYDGTAIRLRQSKTGVSVTVPCTTELKALLDTRERRADTILATPTGRPWESHNFQHKWAKVAKAAGITDLHFHDLRGTMVTRLAEAGASALEIATVTGHGFEHAGRILETYTSRTAALAHSAIAKLNARLKDGSST
jgi:integrase